MKKTKVKKNKKVNKQTTEELIKIKKDLERLEQFTRKRKKNTAKKDETPVYVDSEFSYKTNRANSHYYNHIITELKTR